MHQPLQGRSPPSKRIALLPRQRILIHSNRALQVWDWGRNGTISSLVASELQGMLSGPANPVPLGRSSWRHQCPRPVYRERSLIPFVTNSSVRFVLVALDGLLGLSISTEEMEDGVAPVEVTLVKDELNNTPEMLQDYAYQRGVSISSHSDGTSRTLWYPWPDLKSCQNASTNTFIGPSSVGAVYLNETLNRIHVFNSQNHKYTSAYSKSY
jgi:hypothetical protein